MPDQGTGSWSRGEDRRVAQVICEICGPVDLHPDSPDVKAQQHAADTGHTTRAERYHVTAYHGAGG